MPKEPGLLVKIGATWETVSRFVPKVWRRWWNGYGLKAAFLLSMDEFDRELDAEEEALGVEREKVEAEYDRLTRRQKGCEQEK